MTPKEARRRQQALARERRQRQAERQQAKKQVRHENGLADAFLNAIDRWMTRNPAEDFNDTCPDCGLEIRVSYAEGCMQHAHVNPVCRGYHALVEMMGTKSPPLDSWQGSA